MTVPLMVRVHFAVAGMEAVGVERHLAGEFRKNSSAWLLHRSFSCTSNGSHMF